jgi:hypothetical protein
MYCRLICVFYFLSTSNVIVAQNKCDSSFFIEWTDTTLIKWDDFKSKIDTTSKCQAECVTSIKPLFYLRNDSLFCSIRTLFNTNKSWKKPVKLNNSYDLNHEQLHFDITELFSRRL